MRGRNVCAMLMAGGQGSRLSVLSEMRAKPAVVFGGAYRIIDFTMSNAMHAQIPYVGICTQYRPYSLTAHIANGEAWGYSGTRRIARILPPYKAEDYSDWYAGTADAIYQNLSFIERFEGIEHVLILSGDHIYKMDYGKLLDCHLANDADLTIASQAIPWEDAKHFGIVVADGKDRISGFQEKPRQNPKSNLANLGIYLFKLKTLKQRLSDDAHRVNTTHDFGHDVIPEMVRCGDRVFAYRFQGYWRDVGAIHALWQTNMDVLDPQRTGLDLQAWKLHTNYKSQGPLRLLPAKVATSGKVSHSLVSCGCHLAGEVRDSVISPGVRVHRHALVERAVILNNVEIGEGAVIRNAIIDKETVVSPGVVLGGGDDLTPNETLGPLLQEGISLIGKRALLPRDVHFGRNCLVYPFARRRDFVRREYPSGSTVLNEKYRHALDAQVFHAPKIAS